MGYPHHLQSPMGGSSIDPKFPPSTDEYQLHHHHHHNGYSHHNGGGGMTTNMPPTNNDYGNMHHPTNGIHSNANNYNYSHGISGHFYQHGYNSQMHSTTPNTGYSTSNNNGYYNGYYGTNNANQLMDLPIQCPNAEPTNTVLGLQELGMSHERTEDVLISIDGRIIEKTKKKLIFSAGLRLERRIEEAVPAGQQLQELGMRLRCDDSGSEHVSLISNLLNDQFMASFINFINTNKETQKQHSFRFDHEKIINFNTI